MSILGLELTPSEVNLVRNVQPSLSEILASAAELTAACQSFAPTHDNRPAIEALGKQLQSQIEDLLEATDQDAEKAAAGAVWAGYRNLLGRHVQSLVALLPIVSSQEEGSRLPQKQLLKAAKRLQAGFAAYGEASDTRLEMISATEEIATRVEEVALLDETFDRWNQKRVDGACQGLLGHLRREPTPEPAVMATSHARNPDRVKLSDALDEAITRANCLGSRTHGSAEQALHAVGMLKAMRARLTEHLFDSLSGVQLDELRASAADVQAFARSLINLRSEATGQRGFMDFPVRHFDEQIQVVLRMLEPPQEVFVVKPTIVDKIRNVLSANGLEGRWGTE